MQVVVHLTAVLQRQDDIHLAEDSSGQGRSHQISAGTHCLYACVHVQSRFPDLAKDRMNIWYSYVMHDLSLGDNPFLVTQLNLSLTIQLV